MIPFQALPAFRKISDGSLSNVNLSEEEIKTEDDFKEDLPDFEPLDDNIDISDDIKPEIETKITDEDEPLKKRSKRKVGKKSYEEDFIDELNDCDQVFSCKVCDFVAKSAKALVVHAKKDHKKTEQKSLVCMECSEECKSSQDLKAHLWNVHKLTKASEKCLCSLCGKTIVGRSNFKKHEREKHGIISATFVQRRKPLKIECPDCSSQHESPKSLNLHMIECSNESKDFSCTECDSKWASGTVLNLHMKIDHNYNEMYTCHICGKCLKKKASMDSHIKVEHEKKKDHICHLCGTGFARAQGLRFHMQRIHERSGKYACEYCNFRTVAQLQLDIHINAVHTKSKKFHCDECNFFCYHRQGLLAHVKAVHLKLKPHQCSKCMEAYFRQKNSRERRPTLRMSAVY